MSPRDHASIRGTSARKEAPSILDLVREGVRRFILDDVSIGDFQKMIRKASKKGELSPHPLTGTAFRRIVRQAIAERKRKANKLPER